MSTKPLLTTKHLSTVHSGLLKRHAAYLRPGERFVVDPGDAADDAWILRVVFENHDQSVHFPIEAAIVLAENPGLKQDDARDALIDFVDYVLDRYFRDAREATLPIDWAPFGFGELQVRARGWERNLRLESAADRLLAGESIDNLL